MTATTQPSPWKAGDFHVIGAEHPETQPSLQRAAAIALPVWILSAA